MEKFLPQDHFTKRSDYLNKLADFNDRARADGIDPAADDLGSMELHDMRDELHRLYGELEKERTEAFSNYKSVVGEKEAFNVEDRHLMSSEMAKQLMPTATQAPGPHLIDPGEPPPRMTPRAGPAPVRWTWPNILSALAGLQPEQQ
jgi:hypothetical protein